MSDVKKVFKWWSASDPVKIERWLEAMESEGWHLLHVGWGGTRFHFQKGEPRKMSYCADYQAIKDHNYINIFEDAGWEMIFSSSGWYIWRMPYSDSVKPGIFTDVESLIDRNNRLISMLSIVLFLQIPMIAANLSNASIFTTWYLPVVIPLAILYIPVLILLVVTLFRLLAANKKLKEKKLL